MAPTTQSAHTGAAGSPSVTPNTRGVTGDNQNPHIPTHTSTRKMPKPGKKNAPTFDPERPEELGRFFEQMGDWFADEGITSNGDKKRRIVKYLDADSEIQWKALSKFTDGTFEEFEKEVMASYPKVEEIMKGSVSALKKKIKKLGPVAVEEHDELLSLIRTMMAEVLKLKKIQPPIHTNRELVDLFLRSLTLEFASRVASKLSVHRLMSAQKPEEDPAARNPEDMYDIEEVMKMAKHTVLENSNLFGKYLHGLTGEASGVSVKLEEAVARLSDSIDVQVKYNKQVDQRLASMQSYLTQPRQNSGQTTGSRDLSNRGLAPPQTHISSSGNVTLCFYCKGLHRVSDCQEVSTHLDLCWIVRVDGLLRLPDGRLILRDGAKFMKEVVEVLNKGKAGIISIAKIQDKSALYQDSARLSTYAQSQPVEDPCQTFDRVGTTDRAG